MATTKQRQGSPEEMSYSLEARSSTDDSWYAVHPFVETTLSTGPPPHALETVVRWLRLRFQDFGPEHDELWSPHHFASESALRKHMRPVSEIMQDYQCPFIFPGMPLCVACERNRDGGTQSPPYYDAFVFKVERTKHTTNDKGEEECKCDFEVEWETGPLRRQKSVVKCGQICFLSNGSIEDDPAVQSYMEALKAVNLKGGNFLRDSGAITNYSEDSDDNKPLFMLKKKQTAKPKSYRTHKNVKAYCTEDVKPSEEIGHHPLRYKIRRRVFDMHLMEEKEADISQIEGKEDPKKASNASGAILNKSTTSINELDELQSTVETSVASREAIVENNESFTKKKSRYSFSWSDDFDSMGSLPENSSGKPSTSKGESYLKGISPMHGTPSGNLKKENDNVLGSFSKGPYVEKMGSFPENSSVKPSISKGESYLKGKSPIHGTPSGNLQKENGNVLGSFLKGSYVEKNNTSSFEEERSAKLRAAASVFEGQKREIIDINSNQSPPCAGRVEKEETGMPKCNGDELNRHSDGQFNSLIECKVGTIDVIDIGDSSDSEPSQSKDIRTTLFGEPIEIHSLKETQNNPDSLDSSSHTTNICNLQNKEAISNHCDTKGHCCMDLYSVPCDGLGNCQCFCHLCLSKRFPHAAIHRRTCCKENLNYHCGSFVIQLPQCNHHSGSFQKTSLISNNCNLIDRNQMCDSRFLLIENMEVDVSLVEFDRIVSKVSHGLQCVHLCPSLLYESWKRGYVRYQDARSADDAFSSLNGERLFITSSKGRPWIISRVHANFSHWDLPTIVEEDHRQSALFEKSTRKSLHLVHTGSPFYDRIKQRVKAFLEHRREVELSHLRYKQSEEKLGDLHLLVCGLS